MIRHCIKEGQIVPMEVTVKLLENAIKATLEDRSGEGWTDRKGRFLIDGFPRKMDQALKFDEEVRQALLPWIRIDPLNRFAYRPLSYSTPPTRKSC